MSLEPQSELIFDRILLRQNRARCAKQFDEFNFLQREVANKIVESLEFINRDFDAVLEIGSRDGYLSEQIALKKKVKLSVQTEICDFASDNSGPKIKTEVKADDEFLPFKSNSFDLIVTCLNFQHINLIPQFLLQVKDLLKPNGIFIASFFGEENLSELAFVMFESENEIYGGISPRLPPTIEVKTAAHLIQKAGFVSPISDFEKIEVFYKNPLNLLKDLKMMGQGNVMYKRSKKFFTKKFLSKISENYYKKYSQEDGSVKATFEVVTMTGWKAP
jgi:SAM-dependent methyltransferase